MTCLGQTDDTVKMKAFRVQAIFTPVLAFDPYAWLLPLAETRVTGQVHGRGMMTVAGPVWLGGHGRAWVGGRRRVGRPRPYNGGVGKRQR